MRRIALVLLLLAFATGCDDTVTPTEPLFGGSGEIRVEVRTPIGALFDPASGETSPTGYLTESLVWRSTGPWILAERVSYRGIHGAETLLRGRLNPGDLAREYAAFIRELHTNSEYQLFDGGAPQIEPVCAPNSELSSQVTVTVLDATLDQSARWVRCTRGTLFELTPPAGPDEAAIRVIEVARLTRGFTVGNGNDPTYEETLPYGTLAQGEFSKTLPEGPLAFVSTDGQVPASFVDFWEDHSDPTDLLPSIDWANESVILAAIGERGEAGGSVQVRRVLPLPGWTRVEIAEMVPGDFCAPAAKTIYPYHLVVVPTVPTPVEFVFTPKERISCGF